MGVHIVKHAISFTAAVLLRKIGFQTLLFNYFKNIHCFVFFPREVKS